MRIGLWFRKRGPQFVIERGRRLLGRYSISPGKAVRRIEHLLVQLSQHGGRPTLFVPGMVLEKHLKAIQRLRNLGAEIGVHGYNHVDLKPARPMMPASSSLMPPRYSPGLDSHSMAFSRPI